MFALVKHPLVDCDFEEATLYYAVRNPDLANRFLDVAESATRELASDPLRQRVRFDDVRRVNLLPFPYAIFYFVRENCVYLLAVIHAARDHESALARRRATWVQA